MGNRKLKFRDLVEVDARSVARSVAGREIHETPGVKGELHVAGIDTCLRLEDDKFARRSNDRHRLELPC